MSTFRRSVLVHPFILGTPVCLHAQEPKDPFNYAGSTCTREDALFKG